MSKGTPEEIQCERFCRRAAVRAPRATTPPSAASNSRRPMVTVIRPSRARCVKATIPRHERAVLTARHPARAGRLDFKRFIFGRVVGRALLNAGFDRMSALEATRTRRDGRNDVNDPSATSGAFIAPLAAAVRRSASLARSVASQMPGSFRCRGKSAPGRVESSRRRLTAHQGLS